MHEGSRIFAWTLWYVMIFNKEKRKKNATLWWFWDSDKRFWIQSDSSCHPLWCTSFSKKVFKPSHCDCIILKVRIFSGIDQLRRSQGPIAAAEKPSIIQTVTLRAKCVLVRCTVVYEVCAVTARTAEGHRLTLSWWRQRTGAALALLCPFWCPLLNNRLAHTLPSSTLGLTERQLRIKVFNHHTYLEQVAAFCGRGNAAKH